MKCPLFRRVGDQGAGPVGFTATVNAINASFPANSLPIAVLLVDGVNRLQTIFDYRPSYLGLNVIEYGTGPAFAQSERTVVDVTSKGHVLR